jgi:hypothetical protein
MIDVQPSDRLMELDPQERTDVLSRALSTAERLAESARAQLENPALSLPEDQIALWALVQERMTQAARVLRGEGELPESARDLSGLCAQVSVTQLVIAPLDT